MLQRLALLALPLALALPAAAADNAATAKPAANPATKAPAKPKVSQSRKELRNEAKGLALATETVEQITAGQMDVASRVLTGRADCEFGEHVSVDAHPTAAGHFKLSYKKAVYTMVPQETTSGAVRLEDKKNGIVWIQIPAKSMLMNSKIGQRMVDSCMASEQRAATTAAADAGMAKN